MRSINGNSRCFGHVSKSTTVMLIFLVVLLRPLPTCTSFSPHPTTMPHHQKQKMVVHHNPNKPMTTNHPGFRLHTQPVHIQQKRNNYHRSHRTSTASSFLPLSPLSSTTEFSAALAGATIDASIVARGLGYLVGTGAVLLYTPIAVRVVRQKSADGLTLSTWWLKLASYACSIVYNFDRGYPLSAYLETSVLATESIAILVLVAYYQRKLFDARFATAVGVFAAAVAVALDDRITPPGVLALGQAGSAVINVFALLPQFALNARTQRAGDYSPITASLATVGCTIRLFTTVQLADSDPLLLGSYGLAFLLNGSLLLQILYYGVRCEGRSLVDVLTADYVRE